MFFLPEGGWSTTTTKCVCQKGLQKTWATSTFTIDCQAVQLKIPSPLTPSAMQPFREPQSFPPEDWQTTLITAAVKTMEITSQTSCSPYRDVVPEQPGTAQKGKAMCFLCICVLLCFKGIYSVCMLKKIHFLDSVGAEGCVQCPLLYTK